MCPETLGMTVSQKILIHACGVDGFHDGPREMQALRHLGGVDGHAGGLACEKDRLCHSSWWGVILLSWLSLAAPCLPVSAADDAPLMLQGVTVNGGGIPFEPGSPIHLPSQINEVSFAFGTSLTASNAPLRMRCQLDGFETEWHERTDKMRLMVRFEDEALGEVSIKEFSVTGQSPGWTGRLSDSDCIHRKEMVVVPTNASRFWLIISSAGPSAAVGVYGIRNLQFTRLESGAGPERLIAKVDPRTSETLGPKRRNVEGWARSGLRLNNAQVVRSGPERELTLVLIDDSPEAHTDWITPKNPGFRVQPGERLVFEWDEFYSIGLAGSGSVSYKNLPAGLYRFRMGSLSMMGEPTGVEVSVPVEVPVAFWKTGWFWSAVIVALGGLVMAGWRLSEWRRMKLQLVAIEKTRAIEQERLRIAQDIHDDLGARVTQISLLSSAAQKKPSISAEARAEFASVSQMSRNLVEALYETVWAVNPENDHLDSLVSYICQVANQMCAQAGLKCRLQIPELPHDLPVTSGVRHNLIMAVKEAIHNVMKHAGATEVQILIQFEAGLLVIEVTDNGKGFDPAAKLRGNGLPNMKRRMEGVGGRWIQTSKPGEGTRVRLELAFADTSRTGKSPAAKS